MSECDRVLGQEGGMDGGREAESANQREGVRERCSSSHHYAL